jgi:hypothetical protein
MSGSDELLKLAAKWERWAERTDAIANRLAADDVDVKKYRTQAEAYRECAQGLRVEVEHGARARGRMVDKCPG